MEFILLAIHLYIESEPWFKRKSLVCPYISNSDCHFTREWKFKINEFEANFGWGISAKLPFDLNYGKPTLIQLMVQCHYLWHFADLYWYIPISYGISCSFCKLDMLYGFLGYEQSDNMNLCTINTFKTTMVEGLLELTYLFRQFWPKNIRIKPVYMWCICCVIYRGDNAIRK